MAEIAFETPRLLGRRLEPADHAAMLAVYGDAEGMRYVGEGRPLTAAECERWIAVTAENYRTRGYGMFALVEKATGALVGFCGLVHPRQQVEPELKYAFLRSAWGRGLATEAARGLLAHAASGLGLATVMATVDPEHTVSQRVLEKAGMTRGGRRGNDDGTQTQLYRWTAPDTSVCRVPEVRVPEVQGDEAMKLLAVHTTVATADAARRMARALVERRLAACAQVEPIESFYSWQGALANEPEFRILFKTTEARVAEVEAAIRELHDYELPAIHAVALEHVDPEYGRWLEEGSSP
jgi:RimJ/RimL family protein N-acetyltransferase/uncharacterized protein involved in tolerance to divalent cations